MKELFVLTDAQTGHFWEKPVGSSIYAKSKHPYAYMTLKKAQSVLRQFHPKPNPDTVKIVKYVATEEAYDVQ